MLPQYAFWWIDSFCRQGNPDGPSTGRCAMRGFATIVLAAFLSVGSTAYAQQATQPAPKVTPLMKSPVSGQPDKEFQWLSIEWPAGAGTPPHTHLGDEYGTVLEGAYS